ncbi:MAG TPA: recombination protein O N-terminal domain-containing protein [Candidatus Paceibacterota bacterium]|nr:recombination protein O N-terminal domain-containing protein [Candidatus Paceibacterota bacterium]
MRHKYPTQALVLARTPVAEASTLLTLLTRDVGLVRARAQGVRMPGAKLAAALPTFAESEVVLVAGKDGWRLSGAVLGTNWFAQLPRDARLRAARVATLLLRLVHGESPDPALFDIFHAYLTALAVRPESDHDALETLAALNLLSQLGLDAGALPGAGREPFADAAIAQAGSDRTAYIARINRGIAASQL